MKGWCAVVSQCFLYITNFQVASTASDTWLKRDGGRHEVSFSDLSNVWIFVLSGVRIEMVGWGGTLIPWLYYFAVTLYSH